MGDLLCQVSLAVAGLFCALLAVRVGRFLFLVEGGGDDRFVVSRVGGCM